LVVSRSEYHLPYIDASPAKGERGDRRERLSTCSEGAPETAENEAGAEQLSY
jgi:hypothetical protein